MQKIIAALLIVTGLTQVFPVIGVLGPERLAALYGLSFQEPNLAILMRHRAILFGLLGTLIICAAFRSALRPPAFIAGFVSLASFIAIAVSVGGYNDAIRNLIIGDLVAATCLAAAFVLHVVSGRQG